jgi:hypothetical protein
MQIRTGAKPFANVALKPGLSPKKGFPRHCWDFHFSSVIRPLAPNHDHRFKISGFTRFLGNPRRDRLATEEVLRSSGWKTD